MPLLKVVVSSTRNSTETVAALERDLVDPTPAVRINEADQLGDNNSQVLHWTSLSMKAGYFTTVDGCDYSVWLYFFRMGVLAHHYSRPPALCPAKRGQSPLRTFAESATARPSLRPLWSHPAPVLAHSNLFIRDACNAGFKARTWRIVVGFHICYSPQINY